MNLTPPTEGQICCYVARHGETVLNADNCFRGSADPPLNSKGIAQAHILKSLFDNIDLSGVFCSDKQRAVKTAEIIASGKEGTPVNKSPVLHALNVGKFSGQKRTPEAEAELETYLNSPDTCIPDGESLNDFHARVDPAFHSAVDIYMKTRVPPLFVCHSSLIHELGHIFRQGKHKAVLVEPGGVAAIFIRNGKLDAAPIFRPIDAPEGTHASTLS